LAVLDPCKNIKGFILFVQVKIPCTVKMQGIDADGIHYGEQPITPCCPGAKGVTAAVNR